MSETTPIDAQMEFLHDSNLVLSDDTLQKTILVLKKPAKTRTALDIDLIKKSTQANDFFQSILDQKGHELYEELFQHLEYHFTPAGDVLFEAGSIGTTFYIILAGSAEVRIKSGKMTENGLRIGYKKVKELKPGSYFGELALLEETLKPRTATILCRENCHFATLEWKAYKSLLGAAERRKINAQTDFLGSTSIFKGISNHGLKAWVYIFENKQIYSKNVTLYNEGDNPDFIYLIRSGQVLCRKSLAIPRQALDGDNAVMDGDSQLYVVEKPTLPKSSDIFILGPGEMFGEEEAFAEYRKSRKMAKEKGERKHELSKKWNLRWETKLSSLSCKCTTTMIVHSAKAEIWKVPKKILFAKMEANSRLFRTFIETLFTKKERRENRLVEIQSGLSDYLDFVGTKTSQAFKKDVFAAVKLKKFLQNGEPNLRKFLEERRCSVVLDKEEETSENRQQAKCTDTQPDPAFLTSCNSVRGNQEQVSHSRQFDFNFIKTENPASTRYAPSLIGFEERELAKQDLAPKNVQRFKINLEDNKIGNHDSSNRASVRPSSCAPSNRTRRQTRPMSAMKTSFQAPDKNSIDISTANEDTFNTTLPSTTWKCTPRQDYLSNRARSSKTGDVISPGLFQHITRKSFFITDENSFLKRPERTRIDCTSVRGSMDASYITSPSLTNRVSLNINQITQKIRDSHKHQHKEGEDCESKKGVTENRDGVVIRAHRNQRPISAIRTGKLEDCDKTHRKEKSVNKTCSTEPQTEERSRLFNQALQETYGKRLIKLANLFNNIRNLKRKRETKEQHCH